MEHLKKGDGESKFSWTGSHITVNGEKWIQQKWQTASVISL